MQAVIISGFVTLFALLFTWAEIVREFCGERMRFLLAVASAGSMWVAFTFAPERAMNVITAPLDGFRALTSGWLQEHIDGINPPTEP